jgi:hypothetical protein
MTVLDPEETGPVPFLFISMSSMLIHEARNGAIRVVE